MDNFASFCEINDAGSYFDELKIREPMDLTRTYPDFVLDSFLFKKGKFLHSIGTYAYRLLRSTDYVF